MGNGLLEGKVAVVTGAGGGIGRCHALLLAREGARVVVNDLGVARDGTGAGQRMADQVVAEIQAAAGQAVANYDSVSTREGAAGIMKTALDAFGRVDILVNNAGILRDKTLLKMEEEAFDLVIAVHLKGTFLCSQLFAEHVRERAERGDRGGRIINTSSYAGLIGNFGQTNYAAAKAGIYAMTKVWALELAKYGVTVNCIAPMAKTRMTEDIAAIPETMLPEQVAPMVLYLASDLASEVNGRVFGIHGQQLLEYKMLMTEGVTKPGKELWTPQEIHAKLAQIGADKAEKSAGAPAAPAAAGGAAPAGEEAIIDQAFGLLPKVFVPERAKGWKATIHFDIAGATPWTVTVDDAGCRTEKGKVGTPTCVVTVDKATYAAILTGQEKPEKAFMAGKIRATNLGDMMKFGAAFDQKKARELAASSAPAAGAPAAAGGAAPAGEEAIIDQAFGLLPKVFVPERAKGWKATIHFDIAGASPWTVTVDDAGCRTEKGKVGTPTCVVTVDKATYAAILTGREKPEKAFMAGKIRATNLGDMMKFGAAFDMQKARAMAAQAPAGQAAAPQAGAPAGDPAGVVARGFDLLPGVFQPQHAAGWKAAMVFEVAGAGDWTVSVDDGRCAVTRGKAASPTCVVKTSLGDYHKLLTGELKPEQAFMQGRLTASNLGDMMKFGRAFDMKKVQALLRQGAPAAPAAAGAGAPAAPKQGLDRALIGRRWASPEPQFVRPEHVRLFALATQDENPAYLDEARPGGVIAPPMFSVRLLKDVLFRAVSDPALGADLMRLVHGEQDMEFLRPLRPLDLTAARCEVVGIEEKSTGELLRVEERLYVHGELAVRVRASMFIRDPNKKKEGGAEPPAQPAAPRTIAFKDQVTVAPDQSLRYAEASLDNNPIHTDPEVARLAGFPGVILQGLCTMSFACRAVVNGVAGGDPLRLRRLGARFSKPVLMGDVLTVEGWDHDEREGVRCYGFRVVNQKGDEVITNGVAEVTA